MKHLYIALTENYVHNLLVFWHIDNIYCIIYSHSGVSNNLTTTQICLYLLVDNCLLCHVSLACYIYHSIQCTNKAFTSDFIMYYKFCTLHGLTAQTSNLYNYYTTLQGLITSSTLTTHLPGCSLLSSNQGKLIQVNI